MLLARDVARDVDPAALGVAHLTEDTSTGTGYSLDCEEGSVGIVFHCHAWLTLEIGILSGYLAVSGKFPDLAFRGVEFSFAVRDGDEVEVVEGALREPRREVGGDPRGDVTGDVTPDFIEGEGGSVRLGVADFPEGNEPGLDKGLEAVADAENQAVTPRKEVHHGVAHNGVSQHRCDEFSRSVRFVTCAETTWDEEDLCSANGRRERVKGFIDRFGGKVSENKDFGCATRIPDGAGGIVFGVGARKGGNDGEGFCLVSLAAGSSDQWTIGVAEGFQRAVGRFGLRPVNALKRRAPFFQQVAQREILRAYLNGFRRISPADLDGMLYGQRKL